MEYTLADKILPAYYRTNYRGEYRPLYGQMDGSLLWSNTDVVSEKYEKPEQVEK